MSRRHPGKCYIRFESRRKGRFLLDASLAGPQRPPFAPTAKRPRTNADGFLAAHEQILLDCAKPGSALRRNVRQSRDLPKARE